MLFEGLAGGSPGPLCPLAAAGFLDPGPPRPGGPAHFCDFGFLDCFSSPCQRPPGPPTPPGPSQAPARGLPGGGPPKSLSKAFRSPYSFSKELALSSMRGGTCQGQAFRKAARSLHESLTWPLFGVSEIFKNISQALARLRMSPGFLGWPRLAQTQEVLGHLRMTLGFPGGPGHAQMQEALDRLRMLLGFLGGLALRKCRKL